MNTPVCLKSSCNTKGNEKTILAVSRHLIDQGVQLDEFYDTLRSSALTTLSLDEFRTSVEASIPLPCPTGPSADRVECYGCHAAVWFREATATTDFRVLNFLISSNRKPSEIKLIGITEDLFTYESSAFSSPIRPFRILFSLYIESRETLSDMRLLISKQPSETQEYLLSLYYECVSKSPVIKQSWLEKHVQSIRSNIPLIEEPPAPEPAKHLNTNPVQRSGSGTILGMFDNPKTDDLGNIPDQDKKNSSGTKKPKQPQNKVFTDASSLFDSVVIPESTSVSSGTFIPVVEASTRSVAEELDVVAKEAASPSPPQNAVAFEKVDPSLKDALPNENADYMEELRKIETFQVPSDVPYNSFLTYCLASPFIALEFDDATSSLRFLLKLTGKRKAFFLININLLLSIKDVLESDILTKVSYRTDPVVRALASSGIKARNLFPIAMATAFYGEKEYKTIPEVLKALTGNYLPSEAPLWAAMPYYGALRSVLSRKIGEGGLQKLAKEFVVYNEILYAQHTLHYHPVSSIKVSVSNDFQYVFSFNQEELMSLASAPATTFTFVGYKNIDALLSEIQKWKGSELAATHELYKGLIWEFATRVSSVYGHVVLLYQKNGMLIGSPPHQDDYILSAFNTILRDYSKSICKEVKPDTFIQFIK